MFAPILYSLFSTGKQAKAGLDRIVYNDAPKYRFPKNHLSYEWSTEKDGTIKTLEQHASVNKQFIAYAEYSKKTNKTTLIISEGGIKTKQSIPGLVIIGLETRAGGLVLYRMP